MLLQFLFGSKEKGKVGFLEVKGKYYVQRKCNFKSTAITLNIFMSIIFNILLPITFVVMQIAIECIQEVRAIFTAQGINF